MSHQLVYSREPSSLVPGGVSEEAENMGVYYKTGGFAICMAGV